MASGTWRKLSADGITVNVKADNDAKLPGGKYKNEPIPHSGGNEQKKTKIPGTIENISVHVTALQHEQLQALNDRDDSYSLSAVDVNGNTWSAVGFIDYDGATVAENTGTINMNPESPDGFVLFPN